MLATAPIYVSAFSDDLVTPTEHSGARCRHPRDKRESIPVISRLTLARPGFVLIAIVAVIGAASALTPTTAAAAAPRPVGVGLLPGVAVDAAGTSYVAWVGPEPNTTTLRFCRLARGATACDAGGADSIEAPGTSKNRPFVVVNGSRVVVVQHRYGPGVPGFSQVYRFTSRNRGATFPERRVVGKIEFDEAVVGPGDTVSGATHGTCSGMCFQNVVLDGAAPVGLDGTSQVPWATLSDRPYSGAVGLVDAATPLTVFSDLAGNQQFSRYSGIGAINDEASWTDPVPLGAGMEYPKLAGGPSGLFMLGSVGRDIFVRRFNGTTFGPALRIGAAFGSRHHLFQDAGGRLHALWHRYGGGAGIELVHAVSDGAGWRSGAAVLQPGANDFADPRVATAADHVGVAVWSSGVEREIRVAALGPDAPVDPAAPSPAAPGPAAPGPAAPGPVARPAATLRLESPATARRVRGGRVRLKIRGRLRLPAGVSAARACTGNVIVNVKRGRKRIARRRLELSAACRFAGGLTSARKKVKNAKRLTVALSFPGNEVLGPAKAGYRVKITGRG
jgi:hypothetical protein